MRRFKCGFCENASDLYDWNVKTETINQLTLHEIKDDDRFEWFRTHTYFNCPSCKKKCPTDFIEEVAQ